MYTVTIPRLQYFYFITGILLVVAIGVALGIFFGGVLLSVVSFFRKRYNNFITVL